MHTKEEHKNVIKYKIRKGKGEKGKGKREDR